MTVSYDRRQLSKPDAQARGFVSYTLACASGLDKRPRDWR
jgi:hypothetical protein